MEKKNSLRVAIVHDFLTQYGGGEKVLEAISEIFPDAPIYTLIYKPKNLPETITKRDVRVAGKIGNGIFSLIPILSKYFTFLMPAIIESLDLSEFDLVISSSVSYGKGVITNPKQLHISYVHTPPRFLYGYSVESTQRDAWYYKPVVMLVDHFLKIWDYSAAQRADYLVANSTTVQRRIKKFYGRDSEVIYPPVEFDFSTITSKDNMRRPYYISLGRLAAYKNIDLLISAFNMTGKRLLIVGTGPEEKRLKSLAQKNIEFLGHVSEGQKNKLLSNAQGLIFPVEDEDFGIVPLEAMARGIPVLAHRSGGPTETIVEGRYGMFFDSLELSEFVEKFKLFDKMVAEDSFDKEGMIKHARKFNKTKFQKEFAEYVNEKWKEHNA